MTTEQGKADVLTSKVQPGTEPAVSEQALKTAEKFIE